MKKLKIPYLELVPILIIAFVLYRLISSVNISVSGILGALYSCVAYFVWGFVIAYLLNPAMVYFERLIASKRDTPKRKALKRGAIIAFLYILVIGLITLFIVAILPAIVSGVKEFADHFPRYANNFENWLRDIGGLASPEITTQIETVIGDVFTNLSQLLTSLDYYSIGGAVTSAVSVSVGVVMRMLFGILISVYFLMRKEGGIRHAKRILYALFDESRARKIIETAGEVHQIFMNFFVSKLLESFVLFLIGMIVLVPLRIPLAPLIALVIAVTNMIPYFGPYIGAIPCVLLVLFYDPWKALWTVIYAIGLQLIDNFFVGPRIMSGRVGINPVLVIAGVTIGGRFGGIAGMLLGVPVMAVLKLLLYDRLIERALKRKNITIE